MEQRKVEYTIKIVADESVQTEAPSKMAPDTATTSFGDNLSESGGKQSPKEVTEKKKAPRMLIAGYHFAKRAGDMVLSHIVGTVQLRTGQIMLQERAQFAYNAAKGAFDIVEGAIAGAVTTGSPYGALAGAAISGVFKVVNLGLEQSRLNMSRTVETVGLRQAHIRAGAGGNRIGRNQE